MFSQSDRWVRIGIKVFIAYTILWGVAVQIAMGTATHINTSFTIPWGMSIAVGVTNSLADVVVLLLPQPLIWKLHQSLRTRLLLSGVFLMGILFVSRLRRFPC